MPIERCKYNTIHIKKIDKSKSKMAAVENSLKRRHGD